MKSFAIFAPILGLRKDVPSILLKEVYTPDCQDIIWQNGEVHRIWKRLLEYEYQFPDKILNLKYYRQDSVDQSWFLVFTRRDIAYRDIKNRFVFINKIYNTGLITISSTPTPGTGDLKQVIGYGTEFKTNLKPGDFLKIGEGEIHSGSTWYEIESIESEEVLYLKTEAEECSYSPYVVRQTFSGNDFCYWSVITFHEKMLATNNGMDNIIVWEGSDQVSDLDCEYKTKFLYVYNERVLLVRTVEDDGEHPFRIRWSGLGDETDWDEVESDSGATEVTEGRGVLQGCAIYKGNLLIFKNEAIVRAWNVEGEVVFNKNLLIDNIGTNAPNSIVEMDEGTYFYSQDNTFRFFNGLSAGIISEGISSIVENINPNFSQYIQAILVKELNQILWAVPTGTAEINDRVLIYDLDFTNNNWGVADMEIASFGYYLTEEVYDWETLAIFDNWTDWWWPNWMHKAGLKNFPVDVCSSYDGKIYRINATEKDIGKDYTGFQVIETDLGGGKRLSIYDRLLLIQAYVRREALGTLEFAIKRDDEMEFIDVGSVSLEGENEILIKDLPVDVLAKRFSIKISAKNRFRFLGVFLKYQEVGER